MSGEGPNRIYLSLFVLLERFEQSEFLAEHQMLVPRQTVNEKKTITCESDKPPSGCASTHTQAHTGLVVLQTGIMTVDTWAVCWLPLIH